MGISEARIAELQQSLHELLGPELMQIIEMMTSDARTSPFVLIPTGDHVDRSADELADLVARSSNAYVRAARLNGIARAEQRLAEGAYKKKLKTNLGAGRNKDEREAKAIEAASAEHDALVTLDAIVDLSQAAENAARVSSESSRKLLDKVESMQKGDARGERGFLRDG